MPAGCLSGAAWSASASMFSSHPPKTGLCLDMSSGEILCDASSMGLPSLRMPQGVHPPSRFFSTGRSRRPVGARWAGEDPLRLARLFSAACRMSPDFCRNLPPPAALDIVSFRLQAKLMSMADKSGLVAGRVASGSAPECPGVTVSAFFSASAPAPFRSCTPSREFVYSPPSSFMSPSRLSDAGPLAVDEPSGMVVDRAGNPLVIGLPRNPYGSRVSAPPHEFPWKIDPAWFTQLDEYRSKSSVPRLMERSPELASRALAESWMWLGARFSPRSSSRLKLRCLLVSGPYWCVLESSGSPVDRSAGKAASLVARKTEEAKMSRAMVELVGSPLPLSRPAQGFRRRPGRARNIA